MVRDAAARFAHRGVQDAGGRARHRGHVGRGAHAHIRGGIQLSDHRRVGHPAHRRAHQRRHHRDQEGRVTGGGAGPALRDPQLRLHAQPGGQPAGHRLGRELPILRMPDAAWRIWRGHARRDQARAGRHGMRARQAGAWSRGRLGEDGRHDGGALLMKVVIIGAGVVGVTTAYYLAKYGHEVTVLEKADEVATLASAGNAGLIAPGHSFAWASPTAPKELLRSLTVEDTALRINPFKAPGMAVWGIKFLRQCNAERAVKNTLVKLRLAQYSQRMLDEIASTEQIDYSDIHEGVLYLYRDPKRFEAGVKKMTLVQDHGQKQDVLDADGVAEAEPALAPVKHKLAGGIYAVTDSSGDSVKFCRELQQVCERMGARFRLATGVRKLIGSGS